MKKENIMPVYTLYPYKASNTDIVEIAVIADNPTEARMIASREDPVYLEPNKSKCDVKSKKGIVAITFK
jgi:hypothetical protein